LRQDRHWTCKRNIVGRSRIICTSSGTVRAWYLFTRSRRIYGDLMWTPQWNWPKVHDIFPRFYKIWIFSTDFRKNTQLCPRHFSVIWVGAIIIGKSGLGNKEQMLINIAS
jgi:hypothetical protein